MSRPGRGVVFKKMSKKKDVIDSILGADQKEFECETRELDCLIYRGEDKDKDAQPGDPESPASWKVSRENASVEIWEGKAKIKIKVTSGENTKKVPIQRLAIIAVDAIMAELKKEGAQ